MYLCDIVDGMKCHKCPFHPYGKCNDFDSKERLFEELLNTLGGVDVQKRIDIILTYFTNNTGEVEKI